LDDKPPLKGHGQGNVTYFNLRGANYAWVLAIILFLSVCLSCHTPVLYQNG